MIRMTQEKLTMRPNASWTIWDFPDWAVLCLKNAEGDVTVPMTSKELGIFIDHLQRAKDKLDDQSVKKTDQQEGVF